MGEARARHAGRRAAGDGTRTCPGCPAWAAAVGATTWTYIVGVSAAKMGDLATAEAAEAALKAITAKRAGRADVVRGEAAPSFARRSSARSSAGPRDRRTRRCSFAKEAADAEKTMSAPSGPPEPIKPAFELYGEMLLEAGKAKDAMGAFEQSLFRTPKRTPSVLGLARAAAAAGDQATARARYQELTTMPGAAPTSPAVQEAQKALRSTNNIF